MTVADWLGRSPRSPRTVTCGPRPTGARLVTGRASPITWALRCIGTRPRSWASTSSIDRGSRAGTRASSSAPAARAASMSPPSLNPVGRTSATDSVRAGADAPAFSGPRSEGRAPDRYSAEGPESWPRAGGRVSMGRRSEPRESKERLSLPRVSGPRVSGPRVSGPRDGPPRMSEPRASLPRESWKRASWGRAEGPRES